MTSESSWADALNRVCKERDDLKDRLRETQWQPIETVPKDGTLILVCNTEFGSTKFDIPPRWRCSTYETFGGRATHWMPLPSLPKETNK